MKVSILVQSPLLERTLQLYLRQYLVERDECDFVITDKIDETLNKPICLIDFSEDSDILRPIYKDSLMGDLARFSAKLRETKGALGENMDAISAKNVLDFGELTRLRQSLELINGAESQNAKSPAHNSENDIKDKIDAIVQDFANKLYETIKNG